MQQVFNVHMRQQAAASFPPNVQTKNVHQLAYAYFRARFGNRKKLISELKDTLIRELLHLSGHESFALSRRVKQTLDNFMNSADEVLAITHVPALSGEAFAAREVLRLAESVWKDVTSAAKKDVPMSHAAYLKLYHLSRPQIHQDYDYIMFDEAQVYEHI